MTVIGFFSPSSAMFATISLKIFLLRTRGFTTSIRSTEISSTDCPKFWVIRQPPQLDARSHAEQCVQCLEAIGVERHPVVLGQPKTRQRHVEPGQEVVVERRSVLRVHADGDGDIG